MDQRSLKILEWGKIKQQVADLASFSLGKELSLKLQPGIDFEAVKNDLDLTSKALALLWKHSEPPFGGARDISETLKRVRIGGVLDGTELLQVANLLDCSRNMRQYLSQSEDFGQYIQLLANLPKLRADIYRCLDDDGSMKDNASAKLASIRQKIRTLENRVRDRLNNIIHSSANQKILQESIITIRNGRFVVPVKQEYRSFFSGIVHDQSASGATVFIEPTAVVEANNELRVTLQDEQREIDRILKELSNAVGPEVETLTTTLSTLARLDLLFAKAKYSKRLNATAAKLNNSGYISIKKGRHPLLQGSVVPIDFWLGKDAYILVITGPNTGGKTVTLKTVGLFAIMTQAGLHIPADQGSQMPVFDNIFADIGDEQSIEQSLSTFSSHMTNIVKIMEQISSRSLVLLDELGAGTDPTEGAALATAILNYVKEKRVTTVATTHYSELKNFAYANPEVENASVEFDPITLKPTYRLAIGIPGKSNAFAIAKGLGLSDQIVAQAKSLLNEERVQVDDIIGEIETNQREAREAREEAFALQQKHEQLKKDYEALYQGLNQRKTEIMIEAEAEATALIKETRQELDLLIGELRRQQNIDLEAIVAAKRDELASHQQKLQRSKPAEAKVVPLENLKVGEQVRVKDLNQVGHIVELTAGEALVQIGIMKVNVSLTNLERVNQKPEVVLQRQSRQKKGTSKSASIKSEIDLRGYTIEDAMVAVDKYLDDAFLSSLTQVRIIHGKGTGALREAIQNQLSSHPHAKTFQLAAPNQGGSGVTVVEIDR